LGIAWFYRVGVTAGSFRAHHARGRRRAYRSRRRRARRGWLHVWFGLGLGVEPARPRILRLDSASSSPRARTPR